MPPKQPLHPTAMAAALNTRPHFAHAPAAAVNPHNAIPMVVPQHNVGMMLARPH